VLDDKKSCIELSEELSEVERERDELRAKVAELENERDNALEYVEREKKYSAKRHSEYTIAETARINTEAERNALAAQLERHRYTEAQVEQALKQNEQFHSVRNARDAYMAVIKAQDAQLERVRVLHHECAGLTVSHPHISGWWFEMDALLAEPRRSRVERLRPDAFVANLRAVDLCVSEVRGAHPDPEHRRGRVLLSSLVTAAPVRRVRKTGDIENEDRR
jgi:hypothetical protein